MTFATPPLQDLDTFERETAAVVRGPFRTTFGAIRWRDRHKAHDGPSHGWLVKNTLTWGEQGMIVGASQTGKSFLAIDLGMAIARGVPWFGRKTRQGLVIYHAGESAKGVRDKRLPAYEQANRLAEDEDLPFVLLTLPLDLFASDDDTRRLIAECEHWRAQFAGLPLAALFIDTYSAATPGADENGSKDVSGIRRRCKLLEQTLGCAVILVHHKNAAGSKPRGHTSMFADVENVLDINLLTQPPATKAGPPGPAITDARGRKIREATVAKLKDGEDGAKLRFVLEGVRLGTDEDGDPITSCVVAPPDEGDVEPREEGGAARRGGKMPPRVIVFVQALEFVLRVKPAKDWPVDLPIPSYHAIAHWPVLRDEFKARWFDTEAPDAKDPTAALRRALKDCGEWLMINGYIRKHENFVWRTSKPLPPEATKDGETPRGGDETSRADDEDVTADVDPDLENLF